MDRAAPGATVPDSCVPAGDRGSEGVGRGMGIVSYIAVIAGLLLIAGVTRPARGANRVTAEEHRGSFSFRDPESANVLPAGAAGSGEAGGQSVHSADVAVCRPDPVTRCPGGPG